MTKALFSVAAIVSLILTVALVPVMGAVLFAVVLFAVFILALVGVLAGLEDRTVRQHDPAIDPGRWRHGS